MDPFSLLSGGLSIVGLGMQLFGGIKQSQVAQQQAQVSGQIAGDEQQVNQQKLIQTQMEARRSSLQNVRNAQRLRAQATAAAVQGGNSVGTGMQGSSYGTGQSSVTNAAGFNESGITGGLQVAQNIFGINSDISNKRIELASLGGQAATDQGFASLGGGFIKGGPIIGSFAKDIFKST